MKDYIDKVHLEGGEVIRNIILGMNDGIVSIFALLAGVAGANQTPITILISLLAATIAGALSMGVGDYISSKSEQDFYKKEIESERIEIKLVPDVEKQELRRIYQKKGFVGPVLDQIVNTIVTNPDQWALEMAIAELGVAELEQKSVGKNSFITFFAFFIGAIFPTSPYLFGYLSPDPMIPFYVATFLTFFGLFLVGALKKFITGKVWWRSGLEMLIAGAFAFGVSYLIGLLIGANV